MKRFFSFLAVAALLTMTTACGEKTPTPGNDTTTTETFQSAETETSTTSNNTQPSQQQQQQQNTTKSQTTTTAAPFKAKYYPRYKDFIKVRGGLKNTSYKLTTDNELTVAFMGGSVTQGMGDSKGSGGWRGRIVQELMGNDVRYNALITNVSRAILGGNGSQYGTYVIDEFVCSKKPDLVFLEYCINNAHDNNYDEKLLWCHYESMIQAIRKANPYADIVLVYVSDQEDCAKPIIPIVDKIADYYKLPSIDLRQMILDKLNSGYTWEGMYTDNAHPGEKGYKFMTETVMSVFEPGMANTAKTYKKITTPAPKSTNIKKNAKVVLTSKLSTLPAGWSKVSDFPQNNVGEFGGGIQTTDTSKTLTVKFKGTDFGILVAFGPDFGVLEYQIDGQTVKTMDCYNKFNNPEARILCVDGTDGEHTAKIRLRSTDDSPISLAAFFVNGTIVSVQ